MVSASSKKDLKNLNLILYDVGHFALETHGKEIAGRIRALGTGTQVGDCRCVQTLPAG